MEQFIFQTEEEIEEFVLTSYKNHTSLTTFEEDLRSRLNVFYNAVDITEFHFYSKIARYYKTNEILK